MGNSVNLKDGFIRNMERLLGDTFGEFLASLEFQPLRGLRVNTLKRGAEAMVDGLDFGLERTPVVEEGRFYRPGHRPAKHPFYAAGLYYIQEPSAMLPAAMLPVETGDLVLDMCAAPGGKSTQLASKLGGTGLLVCNDISPSRCKALLKNLEAAGVDNMLVTSEKPEKLAKAFGPAFDKILVDAPCSGEGMLRRDPEMAKHWKEEIPEEYHGEQVRILRQAARLLKPGGRMVYSTCTFSTRENEATLAAFLGEHPEFSLVELEKREGLVPGVTEGFPREFQLDRAVRAYPHRFRGEGHFVALLAKDVLEALPESRGPLKPKGPRRVEPKILEAYREFERKSLGFFLPQDRLHVHQEKLYLEPGKLERLGDLKGIRVLRAGLLLGDVAYGRFEPSQSLASHLQPGQGKRVLDFDRGDPDLVRYLKGETLSREMEKGYVLVAVEGYPLGWAKSDGRILKNKYNKGWRWQ
ncbi:RsmB/NOP family class I SAM-dependent RNA methyltransferase [Anaerotalea alkaliphila]|uniref:SAM-dependent methyltransferase n=1 Tax=Anaerotalea alkaliphila TaxID=2662126 RepID=A0A7X5HUK1_9FIRM|nr:RsmB/NOP family class I SAM-dependent RNA methyltransferase [Anaerotalea alkaliphila]NDL66900.1 SAM-dependent methyltransferase [Anaerotalea alkaliphila]